MALEQELGMAKVTTVYHTPSKRGATGNYRAQRHCRRNMDTSFALELLIAVVSLVGTFAVRSIDVRVKAAGMAPGLVLMKAEPSF